MSPEERAARRYTITAAVVVAIAALTLGGALVASVLSADEEVAAAPPSTVAATTTPPATPTSTRPSTTTTTTSSTTTTTLAGRFAGATTRPARGTLTIHGVGDVNLDPSYIPAFRSQGYAYAWEGLDGLFERDDLTVINLECSPSPLGSPLVKAFTFRCDHDALPPTRAAGIEVANLANNHGQDYGPEAMLDGRRRVEGAGIAAVGVGEDAAQAHQPAFFDIDGWRVAVLGFGGVIPSQSWIATEDRPGMADGDATEAMAAAVTAAAAEADLVIVTIHWGRELETRPNADEVARARALVDAGADVIFGHHQHRLNPLSWYRGKPIFWGLGNFVWPQLSEASATTGVARVVVPPSGDLRACIIPAYIARPGQPVLTGEPPCGEPGPADPTKR